MSTQHSIESLTAENTYIQFSLWDSKAQIERLIAYVFFNGEKEACIYASIQQFITA